MPLKIAFRMMRLRNDTWAVKIRIDISRAGVIQW
jgi:hypothetical protein